jgi:hypothetical protein
MLVGPLLLVLLGVAAVALKKRGLSGAEVVLFGRCRVGLYRCRDVRNSGVGIFGLRLGPRPNRELQPVARMERSAIRVETSTVPDFASLHPGYACFRPEAG